MADPSAALPASCFRRGTQIDTPRGDVAIENLRIGEAVTTISGESRPIRWVGRRNLALLPVRIRPNAFGEGMPTRDLWVSPSHALWVDGVLIPARALVNEISVLQEECCDEEPSYFHLEFDAHEVIMAEGMPAESFVDDDAREQFDNAAEFHRLYPEAARGPAGLCAPRVDEGVTLEYVRTRVAARAATLARTFAPLSLPRVSLLYLDTVTASPW